MNRRKTPSPLLGLAARSHSVALLAAATTIGVLALAPAGLGGTPYQPFSVVGKPLVVSLPSTWKPTSTRPGLVFLAYAPDTNAYAGIADRFPVEQSFDALARFAVESQRQFYLTQYPTATLRHRRLDLAVGPTEQVIVVVRATSTDGAMRRQEIDSYWFQLRGKTYNFSCVFPTASATTYLPVCKSAAASLHAR